VGIDQTLVDIAACVPDELLTEHGLTKGQSMVVDSGVFVQEPRDLGAEWQSFFYLPEVFGTGRYGAHKTKWYGSGFKTQQDGFAMGSTPEEVRSRIRWMLSPRTTERAMRSRFSLCRTDQWSFPRARRELRDIDWERLVGPCCYRPFDEPWASAVAGNEVTRTTTLCSCTYVPRHGGSTKAAFAWICVSSRGSAKDSCCRHLPRRGIRQLRAMGTTGTTSSIETGDRSSDRGARYRGIGEDSGKGGGFPGRWRGTAARR